MSVPVPGPTPTSPAGYQGPPAAPGPQSAPGQAASPPGPPVRRRIGVSDILWTLIVLAPVLAETTRGSASGVATIASLAMVGSLLLRQRAPMVMLAIATAAGLVLLVVDPSLPVSVFALPVVSYSVARWVPGRAARWTLVSGAVGSILGPLAWSGYLHVPGTTTYQQAWGSTVFVMITCAGAIATPYAAGRRILESQRLGEQRAASQFERQMHALAEREQQMRLAEAASRAQIARELHDIVAHSLSLIIVQAEGAKALAAKRPEVAVQTLDTIAESGRESLAEMRRIVSVLRDGPSGPAEYAPTPGLEDIPELVERSGPWAELVVHGPVPKVPQTLGLTVYRVVQEALTNVLRHAGPDAHATVTLGFSPYAMMAEVSDTGRGAAASSDGHGNGLRGMRERVESMGGQLVARPQPGGGFLVRAMIPMPGAPTAPAPWGHPGAAPDGYPPQASPPYRPAYHPPYPAPHRQEPQP